MTITTRTMMVLLGLVGTCAFLGARRSHGQASDTSRATPSAAQKRSTIRLDVPQLVYGYYEWIDKDTALAWVKKKDGSVAALPLTGEHREEKRIGGAEDVSNMGLSRPYAFNISPDRNKVVFLMGGPGHPAGGWRMGTIGGASYTQGRLIEPHGWNLPWTPNSREWISLQGDDQNTRAIHYYVDGVTPPRTVPIRGFAPKRYNANRHMPEILAIRPDGNAIVIVKSSLSEIDFYLMDLEKGRVLAENRQVGLPAGKSILGMSLSHSGDRIAWLCGTERGKDYYQDVWLSNADGSDLKRFSDFPTHKVDPDVPGQPYYKAELAFDCPIRWTVDDKAISCLQGDTFQIVPVK